MSNLFQRKKEAYFEIVIRYEPVNAEFDREKALQALMALRKGSTQEARPSKKNYEIEKSLILNQVPFSYLLILTRLALPSEAYPNTETSQIHSPIGWDAQIGVQ